MIHSTLSNSMSVTDLVPKAATRMPDDSRGDGAFEEALAGAHTVRDQRESQRAPEARDQNRSERSNGRSQVEERGRREAQGPERSSEARKADDVATEGNGAATKAEHAEGSATADEAANADAAGEVAVNAAVDAAVDAPVAEATAEASATAPAPTVAVAAAPIVADLDAIIVPTTTTSTTAATDAVDAAIRLAIDGEAAAAQVADDAAAATTTQLTTTATVAATTTATVAADADLADDAQVQAAAAVLTAARGAEGVETSDAQAGPTSPIASALVEKSGPSPAQLAAATFTEEAPDAAPTAQAVQAVATAAVTDVADGEDASAGATQLAQATAVASDGDATAKTGETVTIKAATIAATDEAAGEAVVVDPEAPEVAQAARNAQGQSATVAANAQFQAQVQAKAAEKSGEEGGETAPPKVEASSTSNLNSLGSTKPEIAQGAVRVRDGLLASGVQARIDHIAEQLATRLKLSQAAGGSQVQLSLKPRELGEVTVQMNVRDGVVAATVLVDRADTLRTLETNLEDLKRSLEQQGLTIQEFSVDVRGDAGAGGANARNAADLRRNATSTSGGSAATVAGAAAVTPGLTGDREVDPESMHDGNVSVLA